MTNRFHQNQSRYRSNLVWVIALLLLASHAKFTMAQAVDPPHIAVLDFGVFPKMNFRGNVGRQAADAVAVEMERTGKYVVTPRSVVMRQLSESGLSDPLDNTGRQKLGHELGDDFVVSGNVEDVEFRDDPHRVLVTIAVFVADLDTAELANGSFNTGLSSTSGPSAKTDDETLISNAIQIAAFKAVRAMAAYKLPTANVVTNHDNAEVTVDRGTRDGLELGLDMIILHGRDRVGAIKLTEVNPAGSKALITDTGKGILPGDSARAVFKDPYFGPFHDKDMFVEFQSSGQQLLQTVPQSPLSSELNLDPVLEAAIAHEISRRHDDPILCYIGPDAGGSNSDLNERLRKHNVTLVDGNWFDGENTVDRPVHFLYLDISTVQRLSDKRARVTLYLARYDRKPNLSEAGITLFLDFKHRHWVVDKKASQIISSE